MAADWIKIREDLHEDASVLQIADRLKVRPEVVVGYLVRFWSWVSRNTDDGTVRGVSLDAVESVLNLPHFLGFVRDAGWLEYIESTDGKCIIIPHFQRHLSESAKKRAKDQRRKTEARNRPSSVRKKTDKRRTRGEERRGEEKREETKSTDCVVSDKPKGDGTYSLEREKKFVACWNATEGVRKNRGETLTKARRAKFKIRLRDAQWPKDVVEALAKFPLPCSGGDKPWMPVLEWILRPDSVTDVLEGKYEWSKEVKGGKPQSEADIAYEAKQDRHREQHKRNIAKRKADRAEEELSKAKRKELGNLR